MRKAKPRQPRAYGRGRIYPRGGVLWVEVYDGAGQKIRRSSGSADMEVAEEFRLKLLRERNRGELIEIGEQAHRLTVGRVLDDFLQRKKLAPGTRATYESQARLHLKPAFEPIPVAKLTTDMLSDYRDQRAREESQQGSNAKADHRTVHRKVASTSINRELAFLRSAMRDLAKRRPGILSAVPFFPMEREDNARQGFLNEKQFLEKLYPELPRHLQALGACAFYCGGRASEWLRADWEDVDFDQLLFYFPKTKNKRPREVPIVPGTMLDALVEAKRVAETMWPNERAVFCYQGKRLQKMNRAWDKACERAGFAGLLFHDMRRSANKNMRDRGVPQGVRMSIMGHRTTSMDIRYGVKDRVDNDLTRDALATPSVPRLRKVK